MLGDKKDKKDEELGVKSTLKSEWRGEDIFRNPKDAES